MGSHRGFEHPRMPELLQVLEEICIPLRDVGDISKAERDLLQDVHRITLGALLWRLRDASLALETSLVLPGSIQLRCHLDQSIIRDD